MTATSPSGASGWGHHRGTASILTRWELSTHGVMAFPLAFAGLPIYLHAPDFYATTLGVPLTLLGTILLILRGIDALQDPFIGMLSDRYPSARPVLLAAGVIALGSGLTMLFNPSKANPALWFAGSVLLCTTGFSIVTILLQTWGGLWQTSRDQRARITTWREAFGLLGLLTAAIAPTLLGAYGAPERAFSLFSLLYLPLLLIASLALFYWLRRVPLPDPSLLRDKQHKAPSWLDILRSPWRRKFFTLYGLNTFASAIPAVLVLFFIRDRLGAPEATGIFLLIYFLTGAAGMPVWQRLAGRFGKIRAWTLSMGVAVLTFLWASFLGDGDLMAFGIICALSGLALGADLALPPAILADHIADSTGAREASRLFSLTTLATKAALALATGLALPLLGLAGYQPGLPLSAEIAPLLNLAYATIPCVLKLCCLVLILKSLPDHPAAQSEPGSLDRQG